MRAVASVISITPIRDTRLMRVRCPYCRRFHMHGLGYETQEPVQHRVADCWGGSYMVVVPGWARELVPPARSAVGGVR